MRKNRPAPPQPLSVDIVIPVYGQAALLLECLNSLFYVPTGIPFTVTCVDDLGPEREQVDMVYDQFMGKENFRVLRNPQNSGFAKTCNRGFGVGKSRLALFLNSDTRMIQPNWLKLMADEFEEETVAVVGPKILYFQESEDPKRPGGKVQTAGIAFNFLGQPYEMFKNWSNNHPWVNQRREINAVTGACLMIRRSVHRQVEGFDAVYTAGNFEDVDLCLKVKAAGYTVVVQPAAVIEHFSGGSENTGTAERNAHIFAVNWGHLHLWDELEFLSVQASLGQPSQG